MARKFVICDLENLAGCSPLEANEACYRAAFMSLTEAVDISNDDLVVIGTNPRLWHVAHRIAPSARIVGRFGPDGADIALVQELSDTAFLAERFSHVIVASGDKVFCSAIDTLNRLGVTTTVAGLPGQMARRLQLVAQRVVWLPLPVEVAA